ncbi:MAG: Thiamine-monophosphate kinase [Leptospirillum sp. Group IV 'UBA BS']|nr:MAG: Thiamine-monophosphate kinase [Leptospirillum sp. Group IV 'UBA BS']MCL5285919.1 thiamine-phosphate kinase [Nitrospirota bacterium]
MEADLIRELSLILAGTPSTGVLAGIGDDAALLSAPKARNILVTTDSQRENVHFRWDWTDPVSVGYRLVAVNVSDIASKGGTPWTGVIAVGLPPDYDPEVLRGVYRGIAEACREYGCSLVGGDLSRDPGRWNFVMTLLGTAPEGVFPSRSGLSEGDALYLLGRPGRARAGFLSLARGVTSEALEPARRAFRRPRALLSEGQALARRPEVVATIDSSDGLERSLSELSLASRKSVRVESLPVTEEVRNWSALLGEDPETLVWTGGEDYDILLGVRKEGEESFLHWVRTELLKGSPEKIHYVGRAVKAGKPAVRFSDGSLKKIKGRGFDHTVS